MSIGATELYDNNYLFNDFNIYDISENVGKIWDGIMISAVHSNFCAEFVDFPACFLC